MDRLEQLAHLSVDVSRETLDRLDRYQEILVKWQKAINLISPKTVNEIWNRHIVDSAQLFPYISSNDRIIDLGSGAGLPGMVLSLLGCSDVTLIESDQRKCAFLNEVKRQTRSTATILNKRIEECDLPIAEVITARACAPIATLLTISSHFCGTDTKYLFLKGKNYTKELEEAKLQFDFAFEHFPNKNNNNEGVILIITNVIHR